MEIYKCDRCGKIFEQHSKAPRLEIYNIEDCFTSERKDLCLKCTAELIQWFNKYNV